jgi:phospholipid transport system substrate-binding protein
MKSIPAVLLAALVLTVPALAETPPEQIVRETTDEILRIVRADKKSFEQDHRKLYKLADEKVLPHFDFVRMSQWVLGRHWRDATPEQRGRFVAEFRDLLVRTYSTALLNYTDQEIVVLPVARKPGDEEVTVRTEVRQKGGAPNVPIHYTFYRKNDAWKVYDVSIEGVSLVTNYRSVYATRIRDEGIEALLASMAQSNRNPAAPGATP